MPKSKVFGAGVPVHEKTTFSVNFRNSEDILKAIEPLFNGSKMLQSQLLILAFGIIARIDPSHFELVDKLELLRLTEIIAKTGFEDFPSVDFHIIRFTELFLSYCKPATLSLNSNLINSFIDLSLKLTKESNFLFLKRYYHQSCSFPAVADLDLVSLIKFSTESFYNATDARFRAFIEEASRVTFQYRDKTVEAI